MISRFFLHKPEGDNEGSVASCAVFSECFWKRWKQEYLQTQKYGRKWQRDQIILKNGDIVLFRDPESQRHNWPLVIVENAIQGKDGRICRVQIRASRNGVSKTYRRLVTVWVMETLEQLPKFCFCLHIVSRIRLNMLMPSFICVVLKQLITRFLWMFVYFHIFLRFHELAYYAYLVSTFLCFSFFPKRSY